MRNCFAGFKTFLQFDLFPAEHIYYQSFFNIKIGTSCRVFLPFVCNMNGVIIIDKPQGFTSFDIVAIVRGVSKEKKTGHTGTLDPMATGVLPVLLGNAAKAQSVLPDSDKEYTASLKFGITTDTLDITGKVLSQQISSVQKMELSAALEGFCGRQKQLPPMFSAVRKNGVRLYELARQGIETEREAREVFIHKLELRAFDADDQTAQISVRCSKGTYIRSLIDDIGKKLGCGAVMTELRRTVACGYTLSDAITVDELKKMSQNALENLLKPTESIFLSYGAIIVSDAQAARFYNGGSLDLARTSLKNTFDDKRIWRVKSKNGDFLGLGIVNLENGLLNVYKHFEK